MRKNMHIRHHTLTEIESLLILNSQTNEAIKAKEKRKKFHNRVFFIFFSV